MRRCLVLLGVAGCGPAPGDSANGADASGTSGTSSAVDTASADAASGGGASSSSDAEESADSSVQFDFGGTGLPDPGEPPDTCALPARPNADVHGTTPIGEVTMTAAVFAEDKGGKCQLEYRVVLAADPATLAEEVERYGAGETPLDVIELGLVLPNGSPTPGTWQASLWQIGGDVGWEPDEVTAEVTSVTTLDADDPHVEVTFSAAQGEFAIEGSLRAPYCALVRGVTCGA